MPLADFWDCSLWEFACSVTGWNKSQGHDETEEGMTPERYDQILVERGLR